MPLVADVLKICHFLSLSAGKPRALATSAGVMACSMSCLFANTTRMAFFSSSSWKTRQMALLFKIQVLYWHLWFHEEPLTLIPQRYLKRSITMKSYATIETTSDRPPTWPPAQIWRCPSGHGHCCPPHKSLHLCWSNNTASTACGGYNLDL